MLVLEVDGESMFQSSARINTGCNGGLVLVRGVQDGVSILSPHQHGLQLIGMTLGDARHCFNPQPASTRAATGGRVPAGTNARVSILSPHQHGLQLLLAGLLASKKGFNPQPASTRAATTARRGQGWGPRVSILSPHQHGLQPSSSSMLPQ